MLNSYPKLFAALIVFAVGLFLFIICSGCAGSRKDFWPVYYQDLAVDETGSEAKHREIFYPFVEIQDSDLRYYFALRPFFNYESLTEEDLRRVQFLWPLGIVSLREGRGDLYRLWPLFQHSRTVNFFTGETTSHGWIFPVVFWGDKTRQGSYRGFFPVYGTVYGVLGDEFSWILFPGYAHFRQGDYLRHDFIWPLFSYGSTEDGTKSTLRLWPLYVTKTKEESYAHNFLMWPFLRWGSEQVKTLDGEPRQRDYAAFHPFYSRKTLWDQDNEKISVRRQLFIYNREFDRRWEEDQTRWALFYSLIRRQNIDKLDEWRFFPLFWRRTLYPRSRDRPEQNIIHHRILWPVLWHTRDASLPDRERIYSIFAPFLWHYRTHYPEEGTAEARTTFWPILTYEQRQDGGTGVYVMSHGWREAAGGYKRNYRPFVEFFRFNSCPEQGRETRLLWRLYRHKRGPQGRHLSIPFLFSYSSSVEDEEIESRSLSLFSGLLKISAEDEESRIRLRHPF